MLVAAATPAAHVVVAKPETETTVRVGDVLVIPLYDSQSPARIYGDTLHFLRIDHIGTRDLWQDANFASFGHPDIPRNTYDAASDRGELLRAVKAGATTALVNLALPRLAEHCVSCRVVHYFIRVDENAPK